MPVLGLMVLTEPQKKGLKGCSSYLSFPFHTFPGDFPLLFSVSLKVFFLFVQFSLSNFFNGSSSVSHVCRGEQQGIAAAAQFPLPSNPGDITAGREGGFPHQGNGRQPGRSQNSPLRPRARSESCSSLRSIHNSQGAAAKPLQKRTPAHSRAEAGAHT